MKKRSLAVQCAALAIVCAWPLQCLAGERIEEIFSLENLNFKVPGAHLQAGRDGNLYFSSNVHGSRNSVLRISPDGKSRSCFDVDIAVKGVAANAGGQIVTGHSVYGLDAYVFYNHDLEHVRKCDGADTGMIEAGEVSGDFYVAQGNSIIRVDEDGGIVHKYDVEKAAGNFGLRFRVRERDELFAVLNAGKITLVGFDGAVHGSIKTSAAAGHHIRASYSGGFDWDEQGLVYSIGPKTNIVQVARYDDLTKDLSPLPDIELPRSKLELDGKIEICGLRVVNGALFVRRPHPTELALAFDAKTGAFKHALSSDHVRLSMEYPTPVWIAGQSFPFAIAAESPARSIKPVWHVWARPYGTPLGEEWTLKDGKLNVPGDAAGLYQITVTSEIDPEPVRNRGGFAVHSVIEIRAAGTRGSVSVYTPLNRCLYGRGEAIPFEVDARQAKASMRVRLMQNASVLQEWTGTTSEKPLSFTISSALTRMLRPGIYQLVPQADGLSPAPQWIVLGNGTSSQPPLSVRHGDFTQAHDTPEGLFDLCEETAASVDRWSRIGMDMTVDRYGASPRKHLAPTKAQEESIAALEKRLADDPLAVSPMKARVGGAMFQAMASYSAYGMKAMAVLTTMDDFTPMGDCKHDHRTREQRLDDVRLLTSELKNFAAFRGWSWATNWWVTWAGVKDKQAAYREALKRCQEDGTWDPILDEVQNKRLGASPADQIALAQVAREVKPDLVTAIAGPYRNPDTYPPITFANVDEIDEYVQFEQVNIPFQGMHALDYQWRPGKRQISVPPRGSELGTGDHLLPSLFQCLMRGSATTGIMDGVNGWGYLQVDARENGAGSITQYRAFNDMLHSYGPWLATLKRNDPIAIVGCSRTLKNDKYSGVIGRHFARLMEAYLTCFHLHRSATIVFEEDLTSAAIRNFKALLLVGQRVEPSPQLLAALAAAHAANVPVFYDGTCNEKFVNGCRPLGLSFDHIENASPLNEDIAHYLIPKLILENLPALEKSLAPAVPPIAEYAQPQVLPTERVAEQGRYLFLVNSTGLGLAPEFMYRISLFMAHVRPMSIPVRLPIKEGTVYDVFAQKQVEVKDGLVQADFRSMPARIFAILPAAIAKIELAGPAALQAGQSFAWSVAVLDKDGSKIPASIPIRVRLIDANGQLLQESSSSAASQAAAGAMVVPVTQAAGSVTLEATELFSGKSSRLVIAVKETALPVTLDTLPKEAPAVAPAASADAVREPIEERFGPRLRDLVLCDGGRLAVANAFNWDTNLYGVDVETGALRFKQKVGGYFAFGPLSVKDGVCVQGYDLNSAEGYHLYAVGPNGDVERRFALFGVPERPCARFLPRLFRDQVNNFAASPDGSWVASAGNFGLAVWNRAGKLLWSQEWWKSDRKTVFITAQSPGTLLVLDGSSLQAYDAMTGTAQGKLDLTLSGRPRMLCVAPDGHTAAVVPVGNSGPVAIVRDGRQMADLPTAASDLHFSPDGSCVAVAHINKLKFFKSDGTLCWTYSSNEHFRMPRVSPDNKLVAVSDDLGTLHIIDAGGRVLLKRDLKTLCTPAWLPGGELLLAAWNGTFVRLDASFRERWRTRVQTEGDGRQLFPLAVDTTLTVRMPAISNAESTPLPLIPNLLKSESATLTGSEGRDRAKVHLAFDTAALCDGILDPPAGGWLPWSALGYIAGGGAGKAFYLKMDFGRKTCCVSAITLADDPAHPESWTRDATLEYFDEKRSVWAPAATVLANNALHTHKLPQPVTARSFRLKLPGAPSGNSRLAEIVLHGQPVETAEPSAPKKPKKGGKPEKK